MDIDDLAQRLKDGFRDTVQNSDNQCDHDECICPVEDED